MTNYNKEIHVNLVYAHPGYDVTSFFRSAFIEVRKKRRKCTFDGFESNFGGAAFYPAQPIGGLIVFIPRTYQYKRSDPIITDFFGDLHSEMFVWNAIISRTVVLVSASSHVIMQTRKNSLLAKTRQFHKL